MDAIQLMLALFLNGMFTCSALPVEDRNLPMGAGPNPVQRLSGTVLQTAYHVLPYRCGDRVFEVWSHTCMEPDSSDKYFTRPFLLVERRDNVGFYLNQFGELHASTTGALQLNDVYVPRCGT